MHQAPFVSRFVHLTELLRLNYYLAPYLHDCEEEFGFAEIHIQWDRSQYFQVLKEKTRYSVWGRIISLPFSRTTHLECIFI
jgi:hypothetical protein